MKRIVFGLAVFAVGVSAAIGIENAKRPGEFKAYAGQAEQAVRRAWDGVAANPLPAALALGTFLLTVVYHKAKGKSLRESVEVAATRVTVIPVPAPTAAEDETPVVKRAKARATRSQLLADQFGLQNRLRKLPEEVAKAEKDVCYTQQAVTDAKRVLADRHKAHNQTVSKLSALRKEKAAGEAELAAIEAELKKLAVLV
jgi:hypothetical protein